MPVSVQTRAVSILLHPTLVREGEMPSPVLKTREALGLLHLSTNAYSLDEILRRFSHIQIEKAISSLDKKGWASISGDTVSLTESGWSEWHRTEHTLDHVVDRVGEVCRQAICQFVPNATGSTRAAFELLLDTSLSMLSAEASLQDEETRGDRLEAFVLNELLRKASIDPILRSFATSVYTVFLMDSYEELAPGTHKIHLILDTSVLVALASASSTCDTWVDHTQIVYDRICQVNKAKRKSIIPVVPEEGIEHLYAEVGHGRRAVAAMRMVGRLSRRERNYQLGQNSFTLESALYGITSFSELSARVAKRLSGKLDNRHFPYEWIPKNEPSREMIIGPGDFSRMEVIEKDRLRRRGRKYKGRTEGTERKVYYVRLAEHMEKLAKSDDGGEVRIWTYSSDLRQACEVFLKKPALALDPELVLLLTMGILPMHPWDLYSTLDKFPSLHRTSPRDAVDRLARDDFFSLFLKMSILEPTYDYARSVPATPVLEERDDT